MDSLVSERTGVRVAGMTEGLLVAAHLWMILVSLHHTPMRLLWYGGRRRTLVWLGPHSPSHCVSLWVDVLPIPLVRRRVRHWDLLLLHRPATHV